jgi:predicted RNA binding protein YcfA (HicA-like mRNA interferase family)
MPAFGPVKRKDLIRYLKQFGFEGPYSGGKHQFMARGEITIRVPNPHQGDIGRVSWRGYCVKPGSARKSGKGSRSSVALTFQDWFNLKG